MFTLSVKALWRFAVMTVSAVVLALCFCAPVSADEQPLNVGFYHSSFYFRQSGSSGAFSGFGYDFLENVSLYLGRPFRYSECNFTRCKLLLDNGLIDTFPVTVSDLENTDLGFDIVRPEIAKTSVYLGLRHGRADLYSSKLTRIGYVAHTVSESEIRRQLKLNGFVLPSHAIFIAKRDSASMAEEYRAGTLDGMIISSMHNDVAIPLVAEIGSINVYLAVRKSDRDLKKKLELALSRLKTSDPWLESQLYVKHLMNGTPLILSEEEQEYLNTHKVLRAVAGGDQKPYSYFEDGQHRGLIHEIIKVFERDLGIRFDTVPNSSNVELFSMLQNGQADVLLDMYADYNWARRKDLFLSKPYLDVDYVTLTRDDYSQVQDPLVAAPYDFYSTAEFVERRYPKDRIVYFSGISDCVRAVAEGQADITFVKALTAQDVISQSGFHNLKVNGSVVFSNSVALGVSSRMDPMLVRILNKEISHLDKSNFKRLVNKMVYEQVPRKTALSVVYHNPLKVIAGVVITMLLIIAGLLFVMSERRRNYRVIRHVYYTSLQTGLHNERWFVDNLGDLVRAYRSERRLKDLFVLVITIRQMEMLIKTYDQRLMSEGVRVWVTRMRSEYSWMLESAISADLSTIFVLGVVPEDSSIERLLDSLSRIDGYFEVSEVTVTIHTVYGICTVPAELPSKPDALVVSAKMARDEAMERGLRYAFYDDDLERGKLKYQAMENNMEKALSNEEFELWIQPKYDLTTRRIVGAEALVRWQSPELGFTMPSEFVELFEKNAFVIRLDYYMLRKVRRFQQQRSQAGRLWVPISVNQSGLHFTEDRYLDNMRKLTAELPVPQGALELEVTESAFIDLVSKEPRRNARKIIAMLRQMGYSISMDDFSKGYSSLSTMLSLPMDSVKIDIAMLHAAMESMRSRKILEGIIHMCKDLNMKVVCEGIETPDQEKVLLGCGCRYGQGFYFCHPVRVREFEEMLDRQMRGEAPVTVPPPIMPELI